MTLSAKLIHPPDGYTDGYTQFFDPHKIDNEAHSSRYAMRTNHEKISSQAFLFLMEMDQHYF